MIRTLGKHIKGYITASILTPLCMLMRISAILSSIIRMLSIIRLLIDCIG